MTKCKTKDGRDELQEENHRQGGDEDFQEMQTVGVSTEKTWRTEKKSSACSSSSSSLDLPRTERTRIITPKAIIKPAPDTNECPVISETRTRSVQSVFRRYSRPVPRRTYIVLLVDGRHCRWSEEKDQRWSKGRERPEKEFYSIALSAFFFFDWNDEQTESWRLFLFVCRS